jgi:hypothetical protein
METGEAPQPVKKEPLVNRAIRKVLSPERATEFLSGQIMMQLEIMYDMQLYPTKFGMTQDQAGQWLIPQEPPAAKWAMDHIGDMWEVSAGFTAMRLGFVALNEVLKKEPIKKLTKGFQVSDEAAFWTSLISTVSVKAMHSMGYISSSWLKLGDMPIGQWHDHVANTVPEMLFGQGVAAIVLAASHYAAKYREPIKNLAMRFGKGVVEGTKAFDKKFNEFNEKIDKLGRPVAPDIAVNVVKEQNDKEVPK